MRSGLKTLQRGCRKAELVAGRIEGDLRPRSHHIAFDNENLLVDFVGVVPPLSLYSTGTPRVESLCICFATSQQSWGQSFCAGPAFALFYQQREL